LDLLWKRGIEMVEPKPTGVVCDLASGTRGFLMAV
jgi:hypothetical protein